MTMYPSLQSTGANDWLAGLEISTQDLTIKFFCFFHVQQYK